MDTETYKRFISHRRAGFRPWKLSNKPAPWPIYPYDRTMAEIVSLTPPPIDPKLQELNEILSTYNQLLAAGMRVPAEKLKQDFHNGT